MADRPRVIVLGGANGAGKTTASRRLLAETLAVMSFVNADAIAVGLSGFDPSASAITAGRIMLERLDELAAERADFAFETTLSGRTYAPFLRQLKANGYEVWMYYFWLNSPDLNVERVALRVQSGGHHIPEATIRQRYRRSIRNFLDLYRPLANHWEVHDNSDPNLVHLIAASGPNGERVIDAHIWARFLRSATDE